MPRKRDVALRKNTMRFEPEVMDFLREAYHPTPLNVITRTILRQHAAMLQQKTKEIEQEALRDDNSLESTLTNPPGFSQ